MGRSSEDLELSCDETVLLEADLALKGSRLEARIILDELIAKLLLAAQEDRV